MNKETFNELEFVNLIFPYNISEPIAHGPSKHLDDLLYKKYNYKIERLNDKIRLLEEQLENKKGVK